MGTGNDGWMRRFVLTITCPDRTGIVAAVTGFIASHGGSVVEAAQHGDLDTARFFQRIEVSADSLPFGVDEFDRTEPSTSITRTDPRDAPLPISPRHDSQAMALIQRPDQQHAVIPASSRRGRSFAIPARTSQPPDALVSVVAFGGSESHDVVVAAPSNYTGAR